MPKIKVMSEQLANMIAAGEVIERPASVVKELVENALDASSSAITINLTNAGINKIQVIDNGYGMEKDDAILAFERHATSKLLSEQDLFHIKTLGFRGEALPSIASIADVHLKTATINSNGFYLNIKGGQVLKAEIDKANIGTDITVNNLFFNTPARLKYLKSQNVELSHITSFISRIALTNPHISFKLTNNQKVLLNTNGRGQLLNVIANLYGANVAKKMLKFSWENVNYKVNGYISEAEINRSTSNDMILIINNRVIKNYGLRSAILEGYHTLLPKGKYPIVVLNIEVDPLLIDVNVHPAKLEVKLSYEDELKANITSEISKVLRKIEYIPESVRIEDPPEPVKKPEVKINKVDFDIMDVLKKDAEEIRESLQDKYVEPKNEFSIKEELIVEEEQYVQETFVDIGFDEKKKTTTISQLDYIGQLFGTYILAQNEEGLFVVDQHAAQERIRYEYFMNAVNIQNNQSYQLLIPVTIDLTISETLIIEENITIFSDLNIEIEKFGHTSFVVRSVPTWIIAGEEKTTINEIIKYILLNKRINISKLKETMIINLSCKSSIKANQFINKDEVTKLLDDLQQCDNPYTCPHGRPVIVKFTKYEIEKMFKRVM